MDKQKIDRNDRKIEREMWRNRGNRVYGEKESELLL
jgi:hypothetical protein